MKSPAGRSRRWRQALGVALLGVLGAAAASASSAVPNAPPDTASWSRILARYYDPVRGMKYGELKAHDAATLAELRRRLAAVDVGALPRADQLAYWI
ncbi:MAG TPA: hypothetical protein VGE98_02000, partial [Thermoanaerobaculia bacterium]